MLCRIDGCTESVFIKKHSLCTKHYRKEYNSGRIPSVHGRREATRYASGAVYFRTCACGTVFVAKRPKGTWCSRQCYNDSKKEEITLYNRVYKQNWRSDPANRDFERRQQAKRLKRRRRVRG
jgi:hypothetical protein